jgi:hypothetical protein
MNTPLDIRQLIKHSNGEKLGTKIASALHAA